MIDVLTFADREVKQKLFARVTRAEKLVMRKWPAAELRAMAPGACRQQESRDASSCQGQLAREWAAERQGWRRTGRPSGTAWASTKGDRSAPQMAISVSLSNCKRGPCKVISSVASSVVFPTSILATR